MDFQLTIEILNVSACLFSVGINKYYYLLTCTVLTSILWIDKIIHYSADQCSVNQPEM